MTDRDPAEELVARLSGVDDPAERVRMVRRALAAPGDALRAGLRALVDADPGEAGCPDCGDCEAGRVLDEVERLLEETR